MAFANLASSSSLTLWEPNYEPLTFGQFQHLAISVSVVELHKACNNSEKLSSFFPKVKIFQRRKNVVFEYVRWWRKRIEKLLGGGGDRQKEIWILILLFHLLKLAGVEGEKTRRIPQALKWPFIELHSMNCHRMSFFFWGGVQFHRIG